MNKSPKFAFLCPVPWADMKGGEQARFCEKCGMNVSNLSSLSSEEREALLQRSRTEKICGAYLLRLNGEPVTPSAPLRPGEQAKIKQAGVAALSAGAMALLAGCIAPKKELSPPVAPVVQEAPAQAGPAAAAPKDDEELILLVGFIVAEEPRKEKLKNPKKK